MSQETRTIIKLAESTVSEYVTAMIGGQLFGLPISRVQDVFMPERLTRVPLSSAEIAGVLNLRGRIVTVVDMRARLGLPKNEDGKTPMAVGVLPSSFLGRPSRARMSTTVTMRPRRFSTPAISADDSGTRVSRSGMNTSCTLEIGRPNNCPPIIAVTYSATVPSAVAVLLVVML